MSLDPGDLRLRDWRPESKLVVPGHPIERARVPAVDAHNHLGRWLSAWVSEDPDAWTVDDVDGLLRLMDVCNLRAIVNLDGRWGDELEENLDRYDRAHPGRFATFCHVDWTSAVASGDVGRAAAASLRGSVAAGAKGIKVWKDLGLHVRDTDGELLLPDDRRLAPLWDAAAELGVPVFIHTADPVAFFDPLDASNERVDELAEQPEWWFGGRGHPSFDELMASLDFEKGGTLARNLFSLYSFMSRRMLEGNLSKDPAPLAEVKKLLGDLREAWDEISTRKGLEEQGTPVTGVNIAG